MCWVDIPPKLSYWRGICISRYDEQRSEKCYRKKKTEKILKAQTNVPIYMRLELIEMSDAGLELPTLCDDHHTYLVHLQLVKLASRDLSMTAVKQAPLRNTARANATPPWRRILLHSHRRHCSSRYICNRRSSKQTYYSASASNEFGELLIQLTVIDRCYQLDLLIC